MEIMSVAVSVKPDAYGERLSLRCFNPVGLGGHHRALSHCLMALAMTAVSA